MVPYGSFLHQEEAPRFTKFLERAGVLTPLSGFLKEKHSRKPKKKAVQHIYKTLHLWNRIQKISDEIIYDISVQDIFALYELSVCNMV